MMLAGSAALRPRWLAGTDAPLRRWRIAIGYNGFMSSGAKYGRQHAIEEVLRFAQKEGFDGVELVDGWPAPYPLGDAAATDEVRRRHEAYGLRIFSIQLGADGAFRPEPAARTRWLADLEPRAAMAAALGAVHVGLWPGGPLGSQAKQAALGHLIDSLRRAGDVLERHGLVGSVEIEPPFVFNTPEDLIALSRIGHPRLGVMFDPSHYDLMNGGTGHPEELLRRVGVPSLGYVHFTDTDGTLRDGGTSKHLAAGEGHVDLEASLRLLWDGGYRGWIMIDAWETEDPFHASRAGLQMLQRFAQRQQAEEPR